MQEKFPLKALSHYLAIAHSADFHATRRSFSELSRDAELVESGALEGPYNHCADQLETAAALGPRDPMRPRGLIRGRKPRRSIRYDRESVYRTHEALIDEILFILHVAKARKKAINIYKGLARAAKATWGLRSKIVRTIYITVIEPIVLFACTWALATGKLGVRKMLEAIQRSVGLKACRAHHTISLHSALILSRLLPLDIRVREATWLYEVKRGKDLGDTFIDRKLKNPVYFGNLPHPRMCPRSGTRVSRTWTPKPWTVSP
ncbi:Putative 115 kDa protein in type-1 retrotransposable element R1DM [Eumeta japonica]|uniref:115 kDa protein in type-1 retrotransposable element R1DM n=1 Tax=Eumeta variegata TaxID=151549 RepID=A0A4C1U8T4_EUMVA|nr:Putative 115 kDa protein in type-1 retrotransposable element R1DM [Eumeta japonica]